jgi:hypothetical protein
MAGYTKVRLHSATVIRQCYMQPGGCRVALIATCACSYPARSGCRDQPLCQHTTNFLLHGLVRHPQVGGRPRLLLSRSLSTMLLALRPVGAGRSAQGARRCSPPASATPTLSPRTTSPP